MHARKNKSIVCSLLTVCCVAIPSFALSQDIDIKFAFSIEKFYKDSLNTPQGIFVDKEQQEIYVADAGRGEVLIFDLKGNPIFKFGKEQGVLSPFDLVVKGSRIYLVQDGKPYIEVFDYRGESVGRVAPPEGIAFVPGRMALDEDGSLYVVNKDRTNCMIFDNQDKFVGTIGQGLASLSGVVVSKDRIYLITPFGGRAVQVYDKNGNFMMAFEGIEGQGGTLELPTTAMIDKEGLLWILDSQRGIVVYDKDYKFVARLGEYGPGKWQLFFPTDIDFDKGNMVYIANKGAKRVSVFKIQR